MHKPAKATLALAVILAGILASESALAARSRGSHGARAKHARGVVARSVIFWPRYYYPPYAPQFAVQPEPWGYIEQGADFYYCADTQKNYPDTQDCPGAWQLITPVPTPGS